MFSTLFKGIMQINEENKIPEYIWNKCMQFNNIQESVVGNAKKIKGNKT